MVGGVTQAKEKADSDGGDKTVSRPGAEPSNMKRRSCDMARSVENFSVNLAEIVKARVATNINQNKTRDISSSG